jgi:hypothetical protein
LDGYGQSFHVVFIQSKDWEFYQHFVAQARINQIQALVEVTPQECRKSFTVVART